MRGPLLLAICVITTALAGLLSGCGLMINSTTQMVSIDTAPPGGVIEVGGARYQTPTRLELKRSVAHVVTIRNPLGATVTRNLCPEPVGLPHVLDLLTFPIVFNIIDAATGADQELNPASMVIPLPPLDARPEFRSDEPACAPRNSRPRNSTKLPWEPW